LFVDPVDEPKWHAVGKKMFGAEIIDRLLRAAAIAAYARTFQGGYSVAMTCGLREPAALVIGGLTLAILMVLLALGGLIETAIQRTRRE
jgi:hypothetical protein